MDKKIVVDHDTNTATIGDTIYDIDSSLKNIKRRKMSKEYKLILILDSVPGGHGDRR